MLLLYSKDVHTYTLVMYWYVLDSANAIRAHADLGIQARNGTQRLDRRNPFNRSIFTRFIAHHYFEGANSLVSQFPHLLKSSLAEAPTEKEIPASMVKMAGISV